MPQVYITPSTGSWFACQSGKTGKIAPRFWSKVQQGEGCWLWTSNVLKNGYGQFWMGAGLVPEYAHRVAWQLTSGPIPDGLFVLHHCDTPTCVRPDHLFLGTHTDNMRDASRKGRLRGRASVESRRKVASF